MRHYLHLETVQCHAMDALHRPIMGSYQWSASTKTAVIELAVVSGIASLREDELNPMVASTYGTGMLIQHSIAKGAKHIILGLGGSATNDAGMGMLAAIGFQFFDAHGHLLTANGYNLSQIATIQRPDQLPAIEWTISCDVTNPLYGPNGAAFVFAPQKGANQEQVELLDLGLRNLARVIQQTTGQDVSTMLGAGAAGGVAGGLVALLQASLHSGIDMVIRASQLEEQLAGASLIITGEGRLDAQSLQGKVVGSMASLAQQYKIPCIAFCGRLDLSEERVQDIGLTSAFEIAGKTISMEESKRNAFTWLEHTARARVADFFGAHKP
jgi:glycerate kinase